MERQQVTEKRMKNEGKTCSYGECERPAFCRGLCSIHYERQRRGKPMEPERYSFRTSTFTPILLIDLQEPQMPTADVSDPRWDPYTNPLSYDALRHHLRRIWGPPAQHLCHYCGRVEAEYLTYDYQDPYGEIRATIREKRVVYSPDPAMYNPACKSCAHALRRQYDTVKYDTVTQ